MIDPGWLGSPTDVATLVVVTAALVREQRRLDTTGAGVVALARGEQRVDDDRLQDDLGVEDVEVRAVQQPVACGGEVCDGAR